MLLVSGHVLDESLESEIGIGFVVITDKNQLGLCVLYGIFISDELEIVLSVLQLKISAGRLFIDTLFVLYFDLVGCFGGFTVIRNNFKAGDYSL